MPESSSAVLIVQSFVNPFQVGADRFPKAVASFGLEDASLPAPHGRRLYGLRIITSWTTGSRNARLAAYTFR